MLAGAVIIPQVAIAFNDTVTATASLNVRLEPTTNSKVLGVLSSGEQVERRGDPQGEWTPIRYNGQDAWVFSAYTSLGSLYYQVPGWPVGFGNKAKAEQLLKQALAINPNGIDPNFFYGDYLLEQGRKAEARQALDKALVMPYQDTLVSLMNTEDFRDIVGADI